MNKTNYASQSISINMRNGARSTEDLHSNGMKPPFPHRMSHDELARTRTDPRGIKRRKKKRRSDKETKKWKKKMKEIGKNHPEFELSYDLLLGIRTSTSTVNSSVIRSSINPEDDDSSEDEELHLFSNIYIYDIYNIFNQLHLSLHSIFMYTTIYIQHIYIMH